MAKARRAKPNSAAGTKLRIPSIEEFCQLCEVSVHIINRQRDNKPLYIIGYVADDGVILANGSPRINNVVGVDKYAKWAAAGGRPDHSVDERERAPRPIVNATRTRVARKRRQEPVDVDDVLDDAETEALTNAIVDMTPAQRKSLAAKLQAD